MKKPTTAPWTAARNSSNGWIRISGPDGQAVANVKTWANAELITATPELLASLKKLQALLFLNTDAKNTTAMDAMQESRALIAKATGAAS